MPERILAIHPKKKKAEAAEFMPGYFGMGKPGLRFADGSVYKAEDVTTFEQGLNVEPHPALTADQVKIGTTG